jgi:hypothetical protein
MRIALASLALVTAVSLGSAAYAAAPPQPAARAGEAYGPAQMGRRAMEHGAMEMGSMPCMSLSADRLAAIKTDLKITKAQSPQWDALAVAMMSNDTVMRHRAGMITGGSCRSGWNSMKR